jgi:hypothetical protein
VLGGRSIRLAQQRTALLLLLPCLLLLLLLLELLLVMLQLRLLHCCLPQVQLLPQLLLLRVYPQYQGQQAPP